MSSQKKILKFAIGIASQYSEDFSSWVKRFISFEGLMLDGLTDQQELLGRTLIQDYNVCTSAGTGLGKSAVAALIIQWFLITHPFCKIPTTAPSGKQLNDILWSEIDFWLKRNRLKDMYVLRKGKLHIKGYQEWYAVARTVPRDGKDLNDTLAGFHGPALLVVVDESSGVPDAVFTALDGAMTQDNSYIFLISNPVSTTGYYYDTISDPDGKGKDFTVLYLDSRDSPLVSKAYEQKIINRYGADSPMYRAKVCGLPIKSSESVVITPEEYDRITSTQRDTLLGRVILGVDVGGSGEDPSVICHRIGNSIVHWDDFPKNETTFLVDEITRIWNAKYKTKPFIVVVDAHGIGAGVYDVLAQKNLFPTVGFIGPEKAFHDTMYKNKRSEAFHRLAKEFKDLHFPEKPPERLKKEIVNVRFDFSDLIAVQEMKALKKLLGHSPDYAYALAMTSVIESFTSQAINPNVPKKRAKSMATMLGQKRNARFGRFKKFIQ